MSPRRANGIYAAPTLGHKKGKKKIKHVVTNAGKNAAGSIDTEAFRQFLSHKKTEGPPSLQVEIFFFCGFEPSLEIGLIDPLLHLKMCDLHFG
jgi:hypothetical protein